MLLPNAILTTDLLNQAFVSKHNTGTQMMMGNLNLESLKVRSSLDVGLNLHVAGELNVDGVSVFQGLIAGNNGIIILGDASFQKATFAGDIDAKAKLTVTGNFIANSPENIIAVGTAKTPSKASGGVMVFSSNGTSAVDGSHISYAAPGAGNTITNTSRTLNIDAYDGSVGGYTYLDTLKINAVTLMALGSASVAGTLSANSVSATAQVSGKDVIATSTLSSYGSLTVMQDIYWNPSRTFIMGGTADNNSFNFTLYNNSSFKNMSINFSSDLKGTLLHLKGDTGYVGVGTSTPAYKFHVVGGDAYVEGNVRIKGTNGVYFQDYGGGWYMQDNWLRNYVGKPPMFQGAALGTTAGSVSQLFSTYATAANNVFLNATLVRTTAGTDWTTSALVLQRVTDTSAQASLSFFGNNIGIGTNTPAYALDINGTLRAYRLIIPVGVDAWAT